MTNPFSISTGLSSLFDGISDWFDDDDEEKKRKAQRAAEYQSLFDDEPEVDEVPGPGFSGTVNKIRQPTLVDEASDQRFPAFQEAWREGTPVEELLGKEPFRLRATVNGNGGDNWRPDVAKVQVLLNKAGYHDLAPDEGPNGYHNARLDKDIRRFQQANKLTVDGKLLPDGETIRTLEERVPVGGDAKTQRLSSRDMGYDHFRDQENWARQVQIIPSGGKPLLTPKDALGMVPLIGDAISAVDAVKEAYAGNYGAAALNAVGVLPAVPGIVGQLAKRGSDVKLAQKKVFIYDAPTLPQRPFTEDYPHGNKNLPYHEEGSPLHADREGRPLTAPVVAGRRSYGGADEGVDDEGIRTIVKGLTGRRSELTTDRKLIGADSGRFVRSPDSSTIYVRATIPDAAIPKVLAHETSHVIDEIAGTIPTDGLVKELETVYNALNNPQNYGPTIKPKHMGYKSSEAPRELMAEAIRAYLTNPNYLKTVAPKTAARIREYANTNPKISRYVQFNALAPAGLGIAASQDEKDR